MLPEDSGLYECQLNTDPKLWRKVNLRVLAEGDMRGNKLLPGQPMALLGNQEPLEKRSNKGETQILAPHVIKVREGDTVSLESITMAASPPTEFSW